MKQCTVSGCASPHVAKGLCPKHYQRLRHHGSTDAPRGADGTPEERFWRFVEKRTNGECWVWTGLVSNAGRGRLKVNGKFVTAYRLSYEMHIGPIPDGLFVLHSCDNPLCVNPQHLFVGTQKDNLDDRNRKGRRVTRYGDDSPIKKLTDAQVAEVRVSKEAQRVLSARYGVSPSLVGLIKAGHRRTKPFPDPQIRIA